ncbi:DUF262 domain-containing protein [Prevotellamassilia timonensis]|uniref:DUF262 domain-containing protein n=1 Tax=Prevotellamassilia timonensis TaxID=1852370 RepID=UPI004027044F
MENYVILEAKPIKDIRGTFYIPAYQRGYRWERTQVKTLLNDLYQCMEANGQKKDYCLQPVVVQKKGVQKKGELKYDLIDGQQRLTTIYILLRYAEQNFETEFSFEYETREKTQAFLENMDPQLAQTNIDFFHIYQAYTTIKDWLEETFPADTDSHLYKLCNYVKEKVKVIWYEVGAEVDPIVLFTRLNVGKIQLTNAELIRALFLSDTPNGMENRRKYEMAIQWDDIEKQLRDDDDAFWAFITRKRAEDYPTRIDLLFDLMCHKQDAEKDPLFTFFKMEEHLKHADRDRVWQEVINAFLQLKEWYKNNVCYHKIGYLIASGSKTMADLLDEARGKRKSEFMKRLDEMIAESITWSTNDKDSYWDLDYHKDYNRICRILLLFNVQSILYNGVQQRFPFNKYNNEEWSIEHIHAQNSEGLKTVDLQLEWLEWHLPSLKAIHRDESDNELVRDVEKAIDDIRQSGRFIRSDFDDIFRRVVNDMSDTTDTDYINTLPNLALLSCGHNTCLSNSTFDVKRNLIIKMDKSGEFIPYCTKMTFLKYYENSSDVQVHFWGQKDREAYLQAIQHVIAPYYDLIKFNA